MNACVQNIMYLSVVAEPNEICHTGSQTIQLYSIDLFKFYSLYLQRELQSFQSYNLSSATTQFQVLMFHFTQILVQYNDRTRPSSRSLQQACRQPVVECRRQAASQMRSRGMLRPVVTWLLSLSSDLPQTVATGLQQRCWKQICCRPVVTELQQCCCGQNCSRL